MFSKYKGGLSGVELAFVLNRRMIEQRAEITIFEKNSRLLPSYDGNISQKVENHLFSSGIKISSEVNIQTVVKNTISF